jgi:hypothetical protein
VQSKSNLNQQDGKGLGWVADVVLWIPTNHWDLPLKGSAIL